MTRLHCLFYITETSALGHPHSIQAKNTTKGGAEFLLVFDSGSFSEDSTFLLTDWLAHVPKGQWHAYRSLDYLGLKQCHFILTEVIAKNFQVDISALDRIPSKQLYIFPAPPPPDSAEDDMVIPNDTPEPYTFALSKMNATQLEGGTVKIVDSSTFKVSKTIAAALVTVDVSILLFTCFKCSSVFFIRLVA